MTQYTVLKVDKEDRIYVPTMLKYVGQIGTESKYANKYSGLVCLEFEDGNAWRFRNEWLEKVEEKEMEKNEFKVGDKVKVIHSDYKGIPVGRIGKVVYEYAGGLYLLHIWRDDYEEVSKWSFYSHELELVSDPKQEAQQVNQPFQDNVNFPSHYQLINDIEVKDVVKVILSRWQSSGQEMSFNQAGMMKELLQYLLRAPLKNKKEDVLKAQWYLNELVKEWEENNA